MSTRRCGSLTGSCRSSRPSTIEKIAVFAPMSSISDTIVTIVTMGAARSAISDCLSVAMNYRSTAWSLPYPYRRRSAQLIRERAIARMLRSGNALAIPANRLADRGRSGLRARAREVRRVVDAARSLVLRDLWIRTQRTRADGGAVDDAGGEDRSWRRSLLDPFDERRERVERARADAAAAVKHPRHHEQPIEVGRRRPEPIDDVLVVLHAHQRVERLIGPAEVADDLAAARLESRQIRIRRVERAARPLELVEIGVDVERRPIVRGIRPPERHVLEERLTEIRLDRPPRGTGDEPWNPGTRRR